MNITDYPLTLCPDQVAEILNVSMPTAYKTIRRKDFPKLKDGNKIIIPRQAFWLWLNTKAVGLTIEDFGGVEGINNGVSEIPKSSATVIETA